MAYGIVTVPSPSGQAGKSAYQYAADGGYPGTEAEFQAVFANLLLSGVTAEEEVSADYGEYGETSGEGAIEEAEEDSEGVPGEEIIEDAEVVPEEL